MAKIAEKRIRKRKAESAQVLTVDHIYIQEKASV